MMRARTAWGLAVGVWLGATPVEAQNAEQLLQQARTARDAGAIAQAVSLTQRYLTLQPGDGGAHWMLGQLLYWQHEYGEAMAAYDRALELRPNDLGLRIDYARMLYALQRYHKAQRVLEPAARAEPVSPDARQLVTDLRAATAPWVNLSVRFDADDQPRRNLGAHIEGIRLLSDALSVRAAVTPRIVSSGDPAAQSSRVDGILGFTAAGTRVGVGASAGAILAPGSVKPIGSGHVEATVARGVKLVGTAERSSYERTLASLDSLLVVTGVDVGLDAGGGVRWAGAVRARLDRYDDANTVTTAYAWMLAPVASALRVGYAYAWQDSDESRWTRDPARAAPRRAAGRGDTIPGRYAPYYTPSSVSTHSALITGMVRHGRAHISARATLPLYAQEQAPVLVRGTTQQIQLTSFTRRYHPWSLGASWSLPTAAVHWTVDTEYNRAAYYSFGQAAIRASWRPGVHAR